MLRGATPGEGGVHEQGTNLLDLRDGERRWSFIVQLDDHRKRDICALVSSFPGSKKVKQREN